MSAVTQLTFSHDGLQLASADTSNTILLWQLQVVSPITRNLPFSLGTAYVDPPVVGPDGKSLVDVTGSQNKDGMTTITQISVWDLTHNRVSLTLPATTNEFALSPRGNLLATVTSPGQITVWNLATGKILSTLATPEFQNGNQTIGDLSNAMPTSLSFSSDGSTLAAASGQAILLWNAGTGRRTGKLGVDASHKSYDFSGISFSMKYAHILASTPDGQPVFSPDGRFLVYNSATTLWNTQTATAQQLPFATAQSALVLWDLEKGKKVADLAHGLVAFSPDSRMLAITLQGQVTFWDTTSGKQLPQVLSIPYPRTGGAGPDGSMVAFSQDGRLIASSTMGRMALWDNQSSTPLIAYQTLQPLSGVIVGFSPDKQWLIIQGEGGNGVQALSLNPQVWQTSACAIAQRNLTASEWDQAFPGEPYQKICPQFPVHPSVAIQLMQNALKMADRHQASQLFPRAVQLALQNADLFLSDMVCWTGATGGFAREALPACDQAVNLMPNDGAYRDSRGLARAVAGDTQGAIQDLEAVSAWAKNNGVYNQNVLCSNSGICPTLGQMRENWLTALKAGRRDLFTNAQTLMSYSQEKDYDPEIWTDYPQ